MKASNGSSNGSSLKHSLHPHQNSLALQLRQSSIVRPDIKQMNGFKPSATVGVGMNFVPGGVFPLPSAVSNLLSKLPPPESFHVGTYSYRILLLIADFSHDKIWLKRVIFSQILVLTL